MVNKSLTLSNFVDLDSTVVPNFVPLEVVRSTFVPTGRFFIVLHRSGFEKKNIIFEN